MNRFDDLFIQRKQVLVLRGGSVEALLDYVRNGGGSAVRRMPATSPL